MSEKAAQNKELTNESGSSQTSHSNPSWKDDAFSQVKGPEQKRCVCCLGKITTSSNDPNTSLSQPSNYAKVVTKVERLHGVIHSLASVIHRIFPHANIDDIIMEANNSNEEALDANSVQNNSPIVNPRSSVGSHQIDENEEGRS